MSKTSSALASQGEIILELARVIVSVVQRHNATEAEKDAALAQIAEFVAVDELDAATAQEANAKLREMIDVLAAAIPAPVEPTPVEEPAPVEEPIEA